MNDLTTETLRRLLKETQARIAELERELANGWQARSLANAQAADNWRNEAAQLSDKLAELEKALTDEKEVVKAIVEVTRPRPGHLDIVDHCRAITIALKDHIKQLAAATKDADRYRAALEPVTTAVRHIWSILDEKNRAGVDIEVGSTALKSLIRWAGKADEQLSALASPAALPGMWHESDLSGGATDCVKPAAGSGSAAAARLNTLRELMGYVQNGSSQTVKLFQDDATNEFFIVAGKKSYFANSWQGVLDAAAEGKEQGT